MPSASCIFIEVSILTIQPVENIGDVLHDENVNHTCIVLPTKLNINAFGFMYITGTGKK